MRMTWFAYQFEVARAGTGRQLLSMEGIRGFAVFLVFVVHYATLVEPWIARDAPALQISHTLHAIGNSGVDLFFVLSGYLIYGTLIARRQQYLPFMRRRVQRIYPTFTVVFVLYVGLSWLFPAESKIPPDWAGIYLLQNFLLLPGMVDLEPMITVAWSLSYEMFYYLTVPLVVAGLDMRTWRRTWRVVFVAAMALLAFLLHATYSADHLRLTMFLAGMLLYEAVQGGKPGALGSGIGFAALVAGLACAAAPLGGLVKMAALFVCFGMFCLCCFRDHEQGALARTFTWTPLRWLGNMSYSYYLLHGLALKAAFLVLGKLLPPADGGTGLFLLLMLPMFVVTLLPSAMLFLCIERPLSLRDTSHRSAAAGPERAAATAG